MKKLPRWLALGLLTAVGLSFTVALPTDRAIGIGTGVPPPEDVSIEITDAGFSPATPLITAGANIHWINNASGVQTVTSESGLFDSAALAAGDGFSISLQIPGHHAYHSANNPAFTGTLMVVLPGLEGPPDALANDHIPDLASPPIPKSEQSVHPTLALLSSRTRIHVGFVNSATVAQANAALANAGVGVLGGIPEFRLVTVEAGDSADFSAVDAAVASLRAERAVQFAALVDIPSSEVVPRVPERTNDVPTDITLIDPWRWNVTRTGADPAGDGSNFHLEMARFPQAWNWNEVIAAHNADIATGVLEAEGFQLPHKDLVVHYDPLCLAGILVDDCTANINDDHGNNVAGVLGATYDNAGSSAVRSLGVSGANPFADMHGMSLHGDEDLDALEVWSLVLDRVTGNLPSLRVVNVSIGNAPDVVDWWRSHPVPNCGPGTGDDGSGLQWCTWMNEDHFIAEMAEKGEAHRAMAERAAQLEVNIVKSSGNYSNKFCPSIVDANLDLTISTAEADAATQPNRSCGNQGTPLDSAVVSPLGWLARHWQDATLAAPIIVDAHDYLGHRAAFSHYNGDISAPGKEVWTTGLNNNYESVEGTSFAAPHVAGLIGLILEYKPTLRAKQVRDLVINWTRVDAGAPADLAPRIDAFMSLMAVNGAARDLVDVNDASADGNRRVILAAAGGGTDVVPAPGSPRTLPDGKVNMRDFRRFRDALLQTCTMRRLTATTTDDETCPLAADISLNGPPDSRLRDLNFDGCVREAVPAVVPNDGCPTWDFAFPRFDFNGDGEISDLRSVKVPIKADGSAAATPADASFMTDLEVLESQWPPALSETEGWAGADLDALIASGDLQIHGDEFFAAGATSVEVTAKRTDTNVSLPSRTLLPGDGFIVMTVPNVPVEVKARAVVGNKTLVSVPEQATLKLGEDHRIDMTVAGLDLALTQTALSADGAATAGVRATVTLANGAPLAGLNVTFTLTPDGTDHATLLSAAGVTDANGVVETTFRAGTILADYTLTAIADLGGGTSIEATRTISTKPPISIHYLWKQENLEWTESGSTRWTPPLVAGQPDCTGADVVPYCLTNWTVRLDQPAAPLERSGVIRGYGDQFRLDETVARAPNASTATWTASEPNGANPVSSGKRAFWAINTDQTHPYADHALPRTVQASETTSGIDVSGLSAIADLGYVSTGVSFLTAGTVDASELVSLSSQLRLGPDRGDASSFRYAGDPSAHVQFVRNPDGTFQPYSFCGEVDTTTPLARGYRVPSTTPWLQGLSTNLGRKPNYESGDLPMPEGSEHLHVRYSFVAVATTGGAVPQGLTLPDCTVNNPPTASFTYTPSIVFEGRVVQFADTSTDPENNISSWQWNFGDGETGSGRTPHHLFKDNGTYTVTLTVTDMNGLADSENVTITVDNLAPEVQADDATAQAGTTLTMHYRTADAGFLDRQDLAIDITTTIPGLATQHFQQSAGNGNISLSGVPDGIYTVVVKVTDKDGGSSSDSATLTVTPEPPPPPPPPGPLTFTCDRTVTLDAEEATFLALVNAYRAVNGVRPVVASPSLTRAAERHVADMVQNLAVEHFGSDGSDPFTRAHDAGFKGNAVGENVARELATGVAVLFGWRSSIEGHNENMLDPRWVAVGIARQESTEWAWATTYGDVGDCVGALVAATSPGPANILAMNQVPASGQAEPLRVVANTSTGSVAAFVSTPAQPAAPAATASLDDYGPVPAFVISPASPNAGASVTIRNRSREAHGNPLAATIDPGTGTSQLVQANGSMTFTYAAMGEYGASASATDAQNRTTGVTRYVGVGAPLPTATPTQTGTPTPTSSSTASSTPTVTATPGTPPALQQVCLNPPINLSNAPHGSATPQQFAIEGDRVYVAWAEPQGVMLRMSTDGGLTFGPQIVVDSAARSVASIAVDGPNVYVAYSLQVLEVDRFRGYGALAISRDYGTTFAPPMLTGNSSYDVWGTRGAAVSGNTVYWLFVGGPGSPTANYIRVSQDAGVNFGPLVNLTVQPGFNGATAFAFQAAGDNLRLLWDNSNAGVERVYYRRSTDRGVTFSAPLDLGGSPGMFNPSMALTGQDVYVVMSGGSPSGIYLRKSTDGGATFGAPMNLNNEGGGSVPSVAAAGNDVYVSWTRQPGNTMFVTASHDGGATFAAPADLWGVGNRVPRFFVSGGSVFLTWWSGNSAVVVSATGDGGVTFAPRVQPNTNDTYSEKVDAHAGALHILWQELIPTKGLDTFYTRTCVDAPAPTATPSPTATSTVTGTPAPSATTASATETPEATNTPVPTATLTATAAATSTATPTFSPIPTDTPAKADTPSPTPSNTATPTPTSTNTPVRTATNTPSSEPAQVFYVTQRFHQAIAKVIVDTLGQVTIEQRFISGLTESPLGPDSIIFDHQGNALISNPEGGSISRIDIVTRAVTSPTINTTSIASVADLALDPTSEHVWAIGWSQGTVWRVSLTDGQTTAMAALPDLGGLTFNQTGSRLFVSSHNGLIFEINPATGGTARQVSVPVGNGGPDGMTFDPASGHVFSSGCGGICELAIGTDAAPELRLIKVHTVVDGDGIAADGLGHVFVVVPYSTLSRLTIGDDTVSLVTSGLLSADDVAPVIGAGAPVEPTATATPTNTATSTPLPTATSTSTVTATATTTSTPTSTATSTPVPTATDTATPPATWTATPVPTFTPTPVPLASATAAVSRTAVVTRTVVTTRTPNATSTARPASSPTASPRTATATARPSCRGDIDHDGHIGWRDLFIELRHARRGQNEGHEAQYDIDGDGRVGLADLFQVARNFGRNCRPDHHEHHKSNDD